jgi:hypothetical protein
VKLVRANLVGLTALAALAPFAWRGCGPIRPLVGALAIFASAFLSVLLIEAGVLVSRSLASGLVHVAILAAVVLLFERGGEGRGRRTRERVPGPRRDRATQNG